MGEDGMMTTGTGMEFDLPGTWSLDSFLRGGTESKIKQKCYLVFIIVLTYCEKKWY